MNSPLSCDNIEINILISITLYTSQQFLYTKHEIHVGLRLKLSIAYAISCEYRSYILYLDYIDIRSCIYLYTTDDKI